MNYDQNPRPLYQARADVRDVAAVNEFLWKVYRWMSLGLAFTGMVAWMVANSPAAQEIIFGNRVVFYGLLFGQLAMVVAFSAMAGRVSFANAAAMFLGYSAL